MTTPYAADSPNALRSAHEAAVETALAALDLRTKVAILSGQDFWSLPAVDAIGLRPLLMSDGPIGVRGVDWSPLDPSIALPSPTALAATWDVDLARRAGHVLGQEARRKGVHVLLAPTVNLHRTPRGGRHFECYSEDPLLTGEIGAGYVTGVQEHSVGVTVKHFVANDSETNRMTVDVRVGDRALRELYLAPFDRIAGPGAGAARPAGEGRSLVGGPAWGVMAAYNSVNGTTMSEHRELQVEVLKDEWGFDGAIVSDWTAARSTAATVTGGLDIAMPSFGSPWGDRLVKAVESGEVAQELVDEQVRRVLRLAARTGALDGAPPMVAEADRPEIADGEAFARELAARSFVLAANDGVLPLALPGADGAVGSIAMIGVGAWEARALGGGSAQVFPEHIVSPLDGMRAALDGVDGVELSYHIGTDPQQFLRPAGGDQWDGGLTAVFTADDGEILGIAPLANGTARWIGTLPEGVDPARLATVTVRGTLLPQATGAHQFGIRGIGQFTMTVDGRKVFDELIYRETDDIAAMFLSPPEERVEVELTEGQPVELALTGNYISMDGMPVFVSFVFGHAEPTATAEELIADAVRAAEAADVAVVVVGTTEEVESEGFDRDTLALPGRQDELVARVAAANPRTVVVVNSGSPVLMPWADDVAAVLLVWFPGQEAGAALADVLLGASEPGGRLPTTWPRREEDCPVLAVEPVEGRLAYDEGVLIGYRAWQRSGVAPLYPFGHGVGYTTWSYDEITLQPVLTEGGGSVGRVAVTVTNTGDRAGREVVQVYLAPVDVLPGTDRPDRWLAGFAVAAAGAGRSVTVEVELPLRSVQTWSDGWRTNPGRYVVEAARSVEDRRIATELEI